jgi:hypothetical protein
MLTNTSGIPFRRGYLLYGAPGSGKTSIIHSLAGELGLDIYIISLSKTGLDDTSLNSLISSLPEQCIAIMEDIDAAFTHGLNRETAGTELEDPRHHDSSRRGHEDSEDDANEHQGQSGVAILPVDLRTRASRSQDCSTLSTAYRHRRAACSSRRQTDTTHWTPRSPVRAAWTSTSSSASPARIRRRSCTSASTSRTHPRVATR